MLKFLTIFVFLALALIVAGSAISLASNWLIKQVAKQPGGSWVAYYMLSQTEAGEAPYAEHVVLARSYWPFGKYYGKVVFAGYCESDLNVTWTEDNQLTIQCTTYTPKLSLEQHQDVQIKYSHPGTKR